MLETELLIDLETLTGWSAYPIKIPQNASYPAIAYKEIENTRNSESTISASNLKDLRYEIILVTPNSEELIDTKISIIERYDGYSGMMGNMNVFISRIESSVPTYDNAQNNFEYNIMVHFTIKL